MKDRKAKIAAAATVLGLGALGGVALGTNPGMPAKVAQVRPGSGPVVTGRQWHRGAGQPVGCRTQRTDPPPGNSHPGQRWRGRGRIDRRLSLNEPGAFGASIPGTPNEQRNQDGIETESAGDCE